MLSLFCLELKARCYFLEKQNKKTNKQIKEKHYEFVVSHTKEFCSKDNSLTMAAAEQGEN